MNNIEQGRETETSEPASEILRIHNQASEIRGACYSLVNGSDNPELIQRARENLTVLRGIIGVGPVANEEVQQDEVEKIEDFLNGKPANLEDILEAVDQLEKLALKKRLPEI